MARECKGEKCLLEQCGTLLPAVEVYLPILLLGWWWWPWSLHQQTLQRAAAAQNSEASSWRLHLRNREGDNGCDVLAKYSQMTKLLLYNTIEEKTNSGFYTWKQKLTTASKQRHFRILNLLFRNVRGPQSAWENMKIKHTGLFCWEVIVLVTAPT